MAVREARGIPRSGAAVSGDVFDIRRRLLGTIERSVGDLHSKAIATREDIGKYIGDRESVQMARVYDDLGEVRSKLYELHELAARERYRYDGKR